MIHHQQLSRHTFAFKNLNQTKNSGLEGMKCIKKLKYRIESFAFTHP